VLCLECESKRKQLFRRCRNAANTALQPMALTTRNCDIKHLPDRLMEKCKAQSDEIKSLRRSLKAQEAIVHHQESGEMDTM